MYKDKKILAIIPARGGSKGIPRKNIRFLNRNPLIAYIIRTAKSSKYIDKAIVTTDDKEIGNISYIFGADEIVERPSQLAEDLTTLDPVIFHAMNKYEESSQESFDIIITLQPTSPLLQSESLDAAIEKFVEKECSTIISVIPVKHLFWEKEEENLSPYHSQRLNRQELSPVYFETGGFVISKREVVTAESRIEEPLLIHELSELEGIDIDNYLDWTLAEKILYRKKFLIRVDGDHEIGMGHIYRTITIASNLLEHDVKFVIKKSSNLGLEKVYSHNFTVIEIEEEEEFLDIVEKENPDIVIVDILNVKASYLQKVKMFNPLLVSFEDLEGGLKEADLVFNALFKTENERKLNHVYEGYKYLCLRDEFHLVPFKTVDEEIQNLLITFGGVDQNNLSEKCLKIIEDLQLKDIDITLILGLGYKSVNDIQKHASEMNKSGFKINVLQDVKLMSQHMYKADLAITSNGRTVYEIAALGVPCIAIAQNER
ncbi:MAG: UDP-2,4-diacetamido-2,4,6-trideoxy-beta-L-altropyranose hydrolase, partial [Candidatus Heimdallarchaeaceae archaeon]